MTPEPELAEPVRVPAPVQSAGGPLTTSATRAPVAAVLRGDEVDARAFGLWNEAETVADRDKAAHLRRTALVLWYGRRDTDQLDILIARARTAADLEWLTYQQVGEAVFLENLIAFPGIWSDRIVYALRIDADEAAVRRDAADALRSLEAIAAEVPAYVRDHGLPLTLAQARVVQSFRLAPRHAAADHITRRYVPAVYAYMGRTVLARHLVLWNGIAEATGEAVRDGTKIVSPADLIDFERRAGAIIAGLPERLRATPWDDPALRVFERDILALQDVALLQGFLSGLIGLLGLVDGWKAGADMFSDRLREANGLIRGGGVDNVKRALTWAYERGYYGSKGAEIWAEIKKHGVDIVVGAIVGLLIGFVVVQFFPGVNVAIDVLVILHSGTDALAALWSLSSAFQAAYEATSVFALQRASAQVADALVGDGLRLLMDIVGMATSIGSIKRRARRLREENPKLTEERAVQTALEEAAGARAVKVRTVLDFLERHGNSELAKMAIRAASGNADDAAVILRVLEGARPSAADLTLLQRVAPSLHEVALTAEAAANAGLDHIALLRLLRDPVLAATTRSSLSRGLRRLVTAGMTEAELAQILTRFGRAEELALILRAAEEMGVDAATTRLVLRAAATEGLSAAEVVAWFRTPVTLLQRQRAASLRIEAAETRQMVAGLRSEAEELARKAALARGTRPDRAARMTRLAEQRRRVATILEQDVAQMRREASEFERGLRSATHDLPGPGDVDVMLDLARAEHGLIRVPLEAAEKSPQLLPRLVRELLTSRTGNRVVYRVEGGGSRQLVTVGANGDVTLARPDYIHLNFGSPERAVEFFAQSRGPGARIVSFEVSEQWVRSLRSMAMPQHKTTGIPGQPRLVDVRFAEDQIELPKRLIAELEQFIVRGTGRVAVLTKGGP